MKENGLSKDGLGLEINTWIISIIHDRHVNEFTHATWLY
jgi:hypothetical protein